MLCSSKRSLAGRFKIVRRAAPGEVDVESQVEPVSHTWRFVAEYVIILKAKSSRVDGDDAGGGRRGSDKGAF